MEFLSSISWFGWMLIALAIFSLWQLPTIYRQRRDRPTDDRKMLPGEDQPTHGPGGWS